MNLIALGLSLITSVVSTVVVGALLTVTLPAVAVLGIAVIVGTILSIAVYESFVCSDCSKDCDDFISALSSLTWNTPISMVFVPNIEKVKVEIHYTSDGKIFSIVKPTISLKLTTTGENSVVNASSLYSDFKNSLSNYFEYQSSTTRYDTTTVSIIDEWKGNNDVVTTTFSITSFVPNFTFPEDWDLTKIKVIPWSDDPRGLKVTVLGMVIDGNTGVIKGVSKKDYFLPYVKISYQLWSKNCENCLFSGQPSPTVKYALFVAYDTTDVMSLLFENDTFEIPVNGLVREGDIVKVYVGSSYPILNYISKCCVECKESENESCDYCDYTLCDRFCETGFILDPETVESFLKTLGYWNEEVVSVAQFLGNVGITSQPGIHIVNNNDEFTTYGSGSGIGVTFMYIGSDGVPRTVSLDVKSTDDSYQPYVNVVSEEPMFNIEINNVPSYLKLNIPYPYSMALRVKDSNSTEAWIVLDPLNTGQIPKRLMIPCPHVLIEGNGVAILPIVGGSCSVALTMVTKDENGNIVCKYENEETQTICQQAVSLTQAILGAIREYEERTKKKVIVLFPPLASLLENGV